MVYEISHYLSNLRNSIVHHFQKSKDGRKVKGKREDERNEGRKKKEEGRMKEEEGRRREEEGRKREEEG